jgi:hypothetical protein
VRPGWYDVDTSKVTTLLGRDFIPYEKVIADTARKLFEVEEELRAKA